MLKQKLWAIVYKNGGRVAVSPLNGKAYVYDSKIIADRVSFNKSVYEIVGIGVNRRAR